MEPSLRAIELLRQHAHRLAPEKQALARYICDNWPLTSRLPKGVAEQACRAYRLSVASLAGSQALARELFLEAARLARVESRGQAAT